MSGRVLDPVLLAATITNSGLLEPASLLAIEIAFSASCGIKKKAISVAPWLFKELT